ncbi:MAG: multidrug efflux SMR transporter [Phycisphaeraceae bacterium]|nr:multidrug efflux SMR transporter [Phycisphaeraceae bacterium]
MIYLWLILAIAFEVGWAVAMKLSHGLTRPWPTAATVVMYLLSVFFLSQATKKMDVGLAYAIWAGAGVGIIAVVGIFYFKEAISPLKLASLSLIIAGIVGLSISSGGH